MLLFISLFLELHGSSDTSNSYKKVIHFIYAAFYVHILGCSSWLCQYLLSVVTKQLNTDPASCHMRYSG